MRATAPTLALARDEIADPSIESHVENATSPAIDAIENIVHEPTLLLVEMVA